MRDGFDCQALDWKSQYIEGIRTLKHLKNGTAFQHRNFAPKCFHCSDVRDVAFCNGYVLAGIHKCIRAWRVDDLKPVMMVDVPYEVFRLSVSRDGCVLGVGHYGGVVTSWLLDDINMNLLQEYIGHTDNVTCLNIATEIDLMCSGSRDRTAKLWCLSSGQLLTTLPASGWVAQVVVTPASPDSVYTHRHALLIADQTSVRLCSWPTQQGSTYGDIISMHTSDLDIPVDKKISMRKFLVQGRSILFVRDGAVIVQDLWTLTEIAHLNVDCRDLVLLASGTRFVLLTLWESCQKNSKLAVINASNGQLIGTYPMPFCREYVVTGNTEWLNDVLQHKPLQLVAAGWMMGVLHMNELTDVLFLVTWRHEQK
ncbi:F-box/WD repeat-containing protein 2-like isoform X2 [Periplaneta americana]